MRMLTILQFLDEQRASRHEEKRPDRDIAAALKRWSAYKKQKSEKK